MATTTPDNIWTPDAGDQYALTQDLGANADSVQSALIRRGNAYKGSSAQRTAFSSAEDGVLWQDTDGIKMVWRRDGVNWVPAVWRWTGSLPQMIAFTAAPVGFHWFNTTDNREYVRTASGWGDPLVGSGLVRLIDFKEVKVHVLATPMTKIAPLEVKFTATRKARYRLTVQGKLINSLSGASREAYVTFNVNGTTQGSAAPHILAYPRSGNWGAAVSDRYITDELNPGEHVFYVQGSASTAPAVVAYLSFNVEEIM